MRFKRYILFLYVMFFALCDLQAQKGDHIVSFSAEITVDSFGQYFVEETIKAWVTGHGIIKQGLFRQLPTKSKTINNRKVPISYELQEVLVNGNPNLWFKKEKNHSLNIYMGVEGVTLSEGMYTYVLKYKTQGQVGFYDDYNELYWNVNGVDWGVFMDTIKAVVHLPEGSIVKQMECYEGAKGSKRRDCARYLDPEVSFMATQLENGENLTIAVGFSKGTIVEPPPLSWFQKYWLLVVAGIVF